MKKKVDISFLILKRGRAYISFIHLHLPFLLLFLLLILSTLLLLFKTKSKKKTALRYLILLASMYTVKELFFQCVVHDDAIKGLHCIVLCYI